MALVLAKLWEQLLDFELDCGLALVLAKLWAQVLVHEWVTQLVVELDTVVAIRLQKFATAASYSHSHSHCYRNVKLDIHPLQNHNVEFDFDIHFLLLRRTDSDYGIHLLRFCSSVSTSSSIRSTPSPVSVRVSNYSTIETTTAYAY